MFNSCLFKKILISLLCFCSYSLSALTLEELQQKLTVHEVLRGDFIQTKTLQMFNQPLDSNGTFLLSHEQGLIWAQKNPFPVSLVLTKDKLRQQFADQPPEIISAADNPMVFYFSHLFLALFKGDLSTLDEQFSMSLDEDNNGTWSLLLLPKQSPLNKVFEKIEIKGKSQIQTLSLIELNQDSSVIKFSHIEAQQPPLNQQEYNAFQF